MFTYLTAFVLSSWQLDPPLSRKNSGFFEGKPTFREVSTFIFIASCYKKKIVVVVTVTVTVTVPVLVLVLVRVCVHVHVHVTFTFAFAFSFAFAFAFAFAFEVFFLLLLLFKLSYPHKVVLVPSAAIGLCHFRHFSIPVDVTTPIYGNIHWQTICVHH